MRKMGLVAAGALSLALALGGCMRTTEQVEVTPTPVEETVVIEEPVAVTEPTVESQGLGLAGVDNARELGGYVGDGGRLVRAGRLLRSARLEGLTDEDAARLKDDYHVGVVCDLRSSFEIEEAPDPELEGVRSVSLHVFDESKLEERKAEADSLAGGDQDSNDMLTKLNAALESGMISDEMYIDWLSSDSGKAAYAALFAELKNLGADEALLFHCTQGKDRTGIAAMLILSVLGVSEDTILNDYLLTNEFCAARIASERDMLASRGLDEEQIDRYMMVMDEVFPAPMENVLAWLDETYGSATDYVTSELGVTQDDITLLRDAFLL